MYNKSLLHKAMNLSLGDSVTLRIANDPDVKAIIKYRGPLKECAGVFLGVQLQVIIDLFIVCMSCSCVHNVNHYDILLIVCTISINC